MAFPVTEYPIVRTCTQLVRSLLPDEPIGVGFAFTPLSAAADASHNVTLIFQTAPGYVIGDNLSLTGFTSTAWNGNFTVTSVSGNQVQFVNSAVASSSPTVIGTVQGYGTGKNYTDTKLMPLINSAYRSLQRALKMAGSTELKTAAAYLTIPAINTIDTSCVITLGYSGLTITSDMNPPPTWLDIPNPTAALPQDCLRPRKLTERQKGTADTFVEVVDMTENGGIPSRSQGAHLGVWEWVKDGINFLGATQDNDIRMEYDRGLPAVSNGGDSLLILECQEFIAFQTCAFVTVGRGGKNPPSYQQMAEDAKEKLIAAETRAQQFVSRRGRGYSSRRGPRIWRF